jgi:hypothetical protein
VTSGYHWHGGWTAAVPELLAAEVLARAGACCYVSWLWCSHLLSRNGRARCRPQHCITCENSAASTSYCHIVINGAIYFWWA